MCPTQTIVSKFNSGGLDLRGVLMALASEVPVRTGTIARTVAVDSAASSSQRVMRRCVMYLSCAHAGISFCLTLTRPTTQIPSTKEDLEIAFKAFDKDGSGSISKGELKYVGTLSLRHAHCTDARLAPLVGCPLPVAQSLCLWWAPR